ncbi:MAG: hypothetical protein BWX47_02010 [candidate division Hyd24-12 bacterium ADurb.Bin004]|nr:MAG: hypothetical protein BWX47_02010 [candidate division Hyd24-12 bacterium ADurb.Bin004]
MWSLIQFWLSTAPSFQLLGHMLRTSTIEKPFFSMLYCSALRTAARVFRMLAMSCSDVRAMKVGA